ncbi:nazgul [Glossina fuscipes fuscipes]
MQGLEMEKVSSVLENADPFKTWWPAVIAVIVGIVVTVRTIMGGQRCPNDTNIKDNIVIITGGSSGIGYEIAKVLAARGGRIILACRNMETADKAAAIIKRELQCVALPNVKDNLNESNSKDKFYVEARYLDLRSFDSVCRFARKILAEFERVDILINNAGIIFDKTHTKTVDGFEQHLQVNYLSHFLLTHLLMPHLQKSSMGRVINVSAHAHASAKMDFTDPLNLAIHADKFHVRDAFAHSKLAVLLSTRYLAKALKGTSVTVNCCTPGLVRGTSHLRNSPLMSAFCIKVMTLPWMWLFMKNPFEGAQCAVHLATEQQLRNISGEYFNDCNIAVSSELGQNDELAEQLYAQTLTAVKKKTKSDFYLKQKQI